MPGRALRLVSACWFLVSLLVVVLGSGGCAAFEPPVPSPSSPSEPGLPRDAAQLPDDFGCLLYQDQGTDQPVWLLQGGSPPRLLARADRSLISLEGRTVAYVRRFPAELWVTGASGAGEQRLYTAPSGSPLIEDLALAPGGEVAVFDLTCPGCPASQDPGALWRLDIPAGTVRQLADHGAHRPLFSPDGKWLSVASPLGTLAAHGSLGLIDLEGGGNLALFEYVLVRDRAWAADSRGFVVAFDPMAPTPVPTELWWIPAAGEPIPLGQVVDVADLSWQPGGGRLIFREWGHDGPTRLVVADRDGGHELPIPGSEGLAPRAYGQLPSWSPDGRWLLTLHDDGTHFLLDVDNRRLHPLEAQVVHGWLDAGHYLVSMVAAEELVRYQQGEDMALDLYRCEPLGSCQWLAQIPRLARLSYAPRCP